MSALTLTTVQTALFWEDKHANLNMLSQKINSITVKTEIIILPEMFSTGFSMNARHLAENMDGPTVEWMKNMAAEKRAIITGSLIIEENQHYYNRLICMYPNGKMGTYDKRHLFAFAGEDKQYTAGNKRFIISVNGWKINMQICYDLRFPVWARQSATQTENANDVTSAEYDIVLYVANWPEKRSHAWRTLLMARAIENQAYCIGVNRVGKDGNDIYYSGDSMIINPLGEALYHKQHGEDIFTITLQKEELQLIRSKMPFLKDADQFLIM